MKPNKNYDILSKTLKISNKNAVIFLVDGLTDSTILQKVLEDLDKIELKITDNIEKLKEKIPYYELDIKYTFEEIVTDILSGVSVLLIDGYKGAICVDCRSYPQKKSQSPDKDKVFKGPRDAFVETLVFNCALIRRRIRDENLRFEYLSVGKITKTDIAVCYIDNKVNKKLLKYVLDKLKNAKVNSVTISREDVANIIFPRKWYNTLPFFKLNERPDTAGAELVEGEIIVLVDNCPNCLMLPTSMFDLLEEANDFYFPPMTRSYLKLARFLILLLTLFGTPLLLLLLTHTELIPNFLSFIEIKDKINIPIIFQLLILEICTDGLRLASLNTPDMLSNTLSILGAVVVGEFAAKSGWFNDTILLYMAVITIASYTQPSFDLSYSIKFFRIFMLIATAIFGLYGFVFSAIVTILMLRFTNTPTGHTYLYPLSPFNLAEFKKKFLSIK